MNYSNPMNWATRPVIHGCSGLLLTVGLCAAVSEPKNSPYEPIIERNSFALKPPPPPIDPATLVQPPSQVKIMFTGIYRQKGTQKACFALTDSSRNPPETTYLSLSAGEKQGNIDVVAIDDKEETVRIKNAGAPMLLSFKDNSPKPAGAAAPPPGAYPFPLPPQRANPGMTAPPVPNAPRVWTVPSAANPSAGIQSYQPNYQPNYNPAGQANTAMPNFNGMGTPMAPGVGSINMDVNNQLTTIPTRNVRVVPTEPDLPTLEPAIQYLNLVGQKVELERKGIPAPPVPPVPGLNE